MRVCLGNYRVIALLLGIQMQRDVIFIVEIFQLGINLLKINKDLGLV